MGVSIYFVRVFNKFLLLVSIDRDEWNILCSTMTSVGLKADDRIAKRGQLLQYQEEAILLGLALLL